MTEGTNGFDSGRLKEVIKKLDDCDGQLASLRGKYMKDCREVRDQIKVHKKEAKAYGIPMKAFNAYLEERKLRAKIEAQRAELEPDDHDSLELIADALGEFVDSPLGQAALERAGSPKAMKNVDALNQLVGDDDDGEEEDEDDEDDDGEGEFDEGDDEEERDLRPRHLR